MKETIGVRLDSKVLEVLREFAEAQHRTLSNMAAVAVNDWVEARRKLLKSKQDDAK